MNLRIGVDLMGGDQPPQAIFEAVLQLCPEIDPSNRLVVLATASVYPELNRQLTSLNKIISSVEFVQTEHAIDMHEPPLLAIRRKKNSTMAVGMQLLAAKKLDAFVSCGNTGALVACAVRYLGCLETVQRPALLVHLPSDVAVLDVGANLSPKPEHLVSYARLGAFFQTVIHGIKAPKIGLLNIGIEEQKGTEALKETYRLLQKEFKERFCGNIEGKDAFQKKVDVLVADGFTGNIFLKTAEGLSNYLIEYVEKNVQNSKKVVAQLTQKFNYAEHPGALLCGVEGIVVKCHGYSDARALMNGIRGALILAERKVLSKIKKKLLK